MFEFHSNKSLTTETPLSLSGAPLPGTPVDIFRDSIVCSYLSHSIQEDSAVESQELVYFADRTWGVIHRRSTNLKVDQSTASEIQRFRNSLDKVAKWLKDRHFFSCRYWPVLLKARRELSDLNRIAVENGWLDEDGGHPLHSKPRDEPKASVKERFEGLDEDKQRVVIAGASWLALRRRQQNQESGRPVKDGLLAVAEKNGWTRPLDVELGEKEQSCINQSHEGSKPQYAYFDLVVRKSLLIEL